MKAKFYLSQFHKETILLTHEYHQYLPLFSRTLVQLSLPGCSNCRQPREANIRIERLFSQYLEEETKIADVVHRNWFLSHYHFFSHYIHSHIRPRQRSRSAQEFLDDIAECFLHYDMPFRVGFDAAIPLLHR